MHTVQYTSALGIGHFRKPHYPNENKPDQLLEETCTVKPHLHNNALNGAIKHFTVFTCFTLENSPQNRSLSLFLS